ncbi:MAG: hypothetical protein AAF367_06545 [Pseudomonadota bacterium]
MKISRLTCRAVPIPLRAPYVPSGGRLTVAAIDSTSIRIDLDKGGRDWGQARSYGANCPSAHGPGVREGLETIAPASIGKDQPELERISRETDAALPGHPFVKSGIHIACRGIPGKVSDLPLWWLVGRKAAERAHMNGNVPSRDLGGMVAQTGSCPARGTRTRPVEPGDPAAVCQAKAV